MTTILVIDDEDTIRDQVAEILQFENFTVYQATNGFEGIQSAQQHLPDLIICDVMMPKLDGFGLLKELRQQSQTALIPFIFLTAKTTRDDLRMAMELGADDYVTKPFTRNELMNAVQIRLAKQSEFEAQKLRHLSQGLVELQEKERQTISQILQEDILQMLTTLKVSLSISKQGGLLVSAIQDIEQLTDNLIEQVNKLSLDLYPTMLHHLGLLPTLLWLFDRFTDQTGIQVHFDQRDLSVNFNAETKLAVYRIVQEALVNVHRHAQTEAVSIQCWTAEEMLHIQIEDNGLGFSVEETLWSQQSTGLLTVQERAHNLGGELLISSAKNRGTNLFVRLPIGATNTAPLVPLHRQSIPAKIQTSELRNKAITVVLADRYEMIRRGLRTFLSTNPQISVIGEASDVDEAARLVEQLKPDILIIDLMLTKFYGLGDLLDTSPNTQMIVLSTQHVDAYIMEALRSGAMGYVLKDASSNELLDAIQQVMKGRRYLSPTLKDHALDAYFTDTATNLEEFNALTRREREILNLLAEGYRNAEIAEELVISPRTAETHRANIMKKLGVHTQAELVRYAMERGWIRQRD